MLFQYNALLADGTLDPNLVGSYNTVQYHSLVGMKLWQRRLAASSPRVSSDSPWNQLACQRSTEKAGYVRTHPNRRSGLVIGTGKTKLKTKQGKVYTDGTSVMVIVKWNRNLSKRTSRNWTEVTAPPNYLQTTPITLGMLSYM
ncbi:hypothetical protein DFP72DRAFT_846336 [Ephemerocybe angulata]|uniref:Uncharacterized protein n=1 Tax=Ephemerocybe angulata TaxID=980116 RepID=A0A8H6LZK3_9AGAR|nr:hypothetical protein DFP72DRAFT_854915 [Tulosesus angulatus]KAF6756964.1 hypothetical protein DFP72DRAFT_846336 [Tulosesus angulatus]